MKPKRFASSQGFDSSSQLRTVLLASLAKLHSPATAQTAYSELRTLINQLAPHQFSILINLLDSNEISKSIKKDYMKVFGVMAELRGSDLTDSAMRIVSIINKRIQEGDTSFQQVIADTFANLNEFTVQTSANKFDIFLAIVDILQNNFIHNNKIAQQISACSLSKVIQTSEPALLESVFKQYTHKTLEILRSPHCKTQNGLLESLLSLILTIEEVFEPCLEETLNTIQNCFQSDEWTARKLSVDIIYTLTVIFPEFFKSKDQLINRLGELRFDKIKHVRDAAQIAVQQLRENKTSENNSRKYRSVFKQNANKSFFDRTSDILIVENKPREQELLRSKNKRDDIDVQNEIYSLPDSSKKSFINPSGQLKTEKSDCKMTPQQQKLLEQVYHSYVVQQSPTQRDRQQSLRSGESSIQKPLKGTPQKQPEFMKVQEATRTKQWEQFDSALKGRVQQVEESFNREIALLKSRVNYLERQITQLNKQNEQQAKEIHHLKNDERKQYTPPLLKENPKDQGGSGSFSQQSVMAKVEEQLEKDRVNEAYCTALTSLDDQIIISTMLKTGPCAERLDSTQVEFLLHKLRTLDWIENALQHHLARMPAVLLKSISNQLRTIPQCEQVQRIQSLLQKQ